MEITFLREYYAGCGVVIRITSIDLLLFLVFVKEVSDAIDIPIPFSIHNVKRIGHCKGKDIIWEAQYLVPYVKVDNADGIGCRLT